MNSTVCQIKSVQDEKAQLDSCVRRTALQAHFRSLRKLKVFKCALWSKIYGRC